MRVLKTIILLLFLKRENKNKISLRMSVLIHRRLNIMLKTFPRIQKVYVCVRIQADSPLWCLSHYWGQLRGCLAPLLTWAFLPQGLHTPISSSLQTLRTQHLGAMWSRLFMTRSRASWVRWVAGGEEMVSNAKGKDLKRWIYYTSSQRRCC